MAFLKDSKAYGFKAEEENSVFIAWSKTTIITNMIHLAWTKFGDIHNGQFLVSQNNISAHHTIQQGIGCILKSLHIK